jgi:hypothetical protein
MTPFMFPGSSRWNGSPGTAAAGSCPSCSGWRRFFRSGLLFRFSSFYVQSFDVGSFFIRCRSVFSHSMFRLSTVRHSMFSLSKFNHSRLRRSMSSRSTFSCSRCSWWFVCRNHVSGDVGLSSPRCLIFIYINIYALLTFLPLYHILFSCQILSFPRLKRNQITSCKIFRVVLFCVEVNMNVL